MNSVSSKKSYKYLIISCCSLLCLLLIWELCTDVFKLVPAISLPSPIGVIKTFFFKLTNKQPDGATLMQHMWASISVALTGYALGVVVGVPLGILMAWEKPIDYFVRPVFDFVKAIPGLAWAPLLVMVIGIGFMSKAVTIFISAMIPCVLNSYAGVKQVKDVHLWVARTFGATRRQMLFTVAIPTAKPFIMTGVRIALGSAWMSIVAAEMIASSKGLGYMIQQCRGIYRPDVIIVGMLMIGALGSVFSFLIGLVEKRVVKGRDNNVQR